MAICASCARDTSAVVNVGFLCEACLARMDRLIAAAPELLAACKLALGAFERNDAIDWDDVSRAIAKAEGR